MHQPDARKWAGTILLCCALATGLSFVATAEDWPQWRGPHRNAVSAEAELLPTWPAGGPRVVWRGSGVGQGYASVAVSRGRLFTIGTVGQDVSCHALDAETGRHLWSRQFGTTSRDSCSTPTVDDDRVYALAPDGELVCLDAETGLIVWRRHLPDEFDGRMPGRGYGESPLVDGNWLVCTPGGADAMLVALNKRTGGVVWKSTMPDMGPAGYDGAGFSSIVVSQAAGVRQYIQLVGRGLIGVAANDGRFLWGYNSLANRTANIPTPVVHGDLVFAANGYNTGSVLLKLVSQGKQGVGTEEVYRLNGSRFQNHHGGIVLVGDFIYGGHGSNNGLPTCIELQSGRVKWKRRGPGVGSASVVYADGKLYFRYQNGIMALVDATDGGYRLNGEFPIPGAGGDSWAHPVIAQGKLYLREKDNLWVYDLKRTVGSSTASQIEPLRADHSLDSIRNLGGTVAPVSIAEHRDTADKRRLYRFARTSSGSRGADNRIAQISLGNRHLTSRGMITQDLQEHLQGLASPFILELAGTDVSDSGLKQLRELPSLVGINLELCRRMTDVGLEQISYVPHARVVLLTGTQVTDRGLVHLLRMKTLIALDLEVCDGVTDVGCQTLGQMKQLKALVLRKAGFESIRITGEGVGHLQDLTGLELLDLYGNNIDDDGLAPLERMTRLRELNLSLLPITHRGLEHVHTLRDLQHLALVYSTGFAGPIISDDGLDPLAELASLQTLNLVGAQITDSGLARLASLKKLTRLKLVNTRVSDAGVRELQLALPACQIMR